MKKIFTVLFLFATVVAGAQSLQLKHNGQIINNNDTITVMETPDKVTDNLFIEYSNVGSSDLYFKVRKEELSMVNGAQATFCIGGTCYAGNLSQELFIFEGDVVTVEDETNVFHATYTSDQPGTSIVKYTFFNTDDVDDAVSFYVVYVVETVGVSSVTADNVLKAYPNPAYNTVNIDYATAHANTCLVIKNLTGAVVYRSEVEGKGRQEVNLSNFKAGVYFYGLEYNGKMQQTKKLVVK